MLATEIENTFEQQKISLKYTDDARLYFQRFKTLRLQITAVKIIIY